MYILFISEQYAKFISLLMSDQYWTDQPGAPFTKLFMTELIHKT